MTTDEALIQFLTGTTRAVAALVGDAIYPVEAAQGLPNNGRYIVYQKIASTAATSHGQPGDAEDTLDESLYQFSCYAPTAKEAKAIRRALRSDILYPGAMTGIVVTAPVERDGDEPEVDSKRADLDVTIFHNPLAA
jgi:hypothetical protein